MAAMFAFACMALNVTLLGLTFGLRDSPLTFLVWGAFAMILAYGFKLKLLLATGLLSLAWFAAALVHQAAGGHWGEALVYPETVLLAGAVLLALSFANWGAAPGFSLVYRFLGMVLVLIPMVILARFGWLSYLPWSPHGIEIGYQVFGFAASAAALWLGLRAGIREIAYFGALLSVVLLYLKFFDWLWDWMPKYLFFLIVAAVAAGAVACTQPTSLRAGRDADWERGVRRRAVWLLIALVVVADLVIVALAAWNRSGAPECVLTLSERELSLPEFRDEDSTGLAMELTATEQAPRAVRRIAWRRRAEWGRVEHSWLDDAKLAELGFRTAWSQGDAVAEERYARRAARPAFVVLEQDGDGFGRWLAAREAELALARTELTEGKVDTARIADLEALLALDRVMRSRLFPVDAGRDPRALRARYPDRGRYCVAPGLIRLWLDRPAGQKPRIRGRVVLLLGDVDVPLRLRSRLAGFLPGETADQLDARERLQDKPPWPTPVPPRYVVKVAFGRSYEPWIVDISPVGAPGSSDSASR